MSGLKTGSDHAVPFLEFPSMITNIKPYNDSLLIIGTGGNERLDLQPIYTQKTSASRYAKDWLRILSISLRRMRKDIYGVGTEKGIDRIKPNSAYDLMENIHYGFENGLTGVETNQNAFYFSGKEKYFGLVDGAYEFNDLQSVGKKDIRPAPYRCSFLYGEHPRQHVCR